MADSWHKSFQRKWIYCDDSYPQDDNGNDTRSYLTQKLYAKDGKYLLCIGYAYRNRLEDDMKPTNIDVRLNEKIMEICCNATKQQVGMM